MSVPLRGYQLGVDLGTTFLAAAVVREGRAEAVTLGTHGVAVPAAIYLGDDGMVVGEAAVLRSAGEPGRVAREFKRRVGDPAPILVGGVPMAAELLMARALAWVVGEVARTEGGPPAALAVTHPANWGEYKLDLLRQAIRHVGLRVDHLVPEPVAAARFYAAERHLAPGSVVAVYDLGGGTFDAAVVRVDDGGRDSDKGYDQGGYTLLGRPDGVERLGGIDFDQAVFGHVLGVLGLDPATLDPDDAALATGLAVLRRDCVEAKEALSNDTDVAIPVLLPGRHTQVRLTRTELEAMVRPALAETVVALRRAVASTGVAVDELAAVLLVGGSSRIPLVGQLVSAELRRPIAIDARPKDAICLGAALIAAETPVAEPAVPAPAAVVTTPISPDAPAAPTPGAAGRPPWRTAAAIGAAVAVLVTAIFAVQGRGGGGGGGGGGDDETGNDGQTAGPRPTEGYDPAADGAVADSFDLDGVALTVGWKNEPEAELVGQITLEALAAAGATTTPQVTPVSSDDVHGGLLAGDVDLYWDHLIDVWRRTLGRTDDAAHDPVELRDMVAEAEAGEGNEIAWLAPAGFDPGFTLVATGDSRLATLSDLTTLGDDTRATMCSTQDPSGLVDRVEQGYGLALPEWQQVTAVDLFPKVADGSCTLGVAPRSSGALAAHGLVGLEDDRRLLAAAHMAPAVRPALLDDHPEIEDLLAALATDLDHETVLALNTQVDVDGRAPQDVARAWLVAAGFVADPGGSGAGPAGPEIAAEFDLAGTTFRLGTLGTDEQAVLGEVTRQALEEAGAGVETRGFEAGGADEPRDALVAGDVDLAWDYLAPTWVDQLDHVTPGGDGDLLYERVASEDAANGVTWLPPAAYDRGWAIVGARERAEGLGVGSIADLERAPDDDPAVTLVCSEINTTAREWIESAYGFEVTSFRVVDDDIEGLVDAGECAFGMVRASSPWIAALDLVVLRDERKAMPADRAAMMVRPDLDEAQPQLAALVGALGDALTDDTIRTLTRRVVADGEAPADVARSWLREAGFVRA
jgi:glycine betaine/choline ABC-type transport system substrate-binding protein